ncbi:MAG: amino acid permease [Candidatus Paceibacterota bacterium]
MLNPEKFLSKTKRKLGLPFLVFIGVGGTVGPGIFVLLSPGAKIAGTALPWAFLFGGILSLGVALIYAEFGSAMPTSGASLNLLFKAFGRGYLPFVTSWLVVLGDISAVAISALAFGYYTSLLVPINSVVLALSMLIIIVLLNIRGITKTALVQGIVALVLLIGLAFLTGKLFSETSIGFNLSNTSGGLISILAATAVIYTAFIGYEDIVSVAGEVENPDRNVALALILTVVIVTTLFFLISWVAVNVVPPEVLGEAEAPLFLVAEKLGGLGKIIVFTTAILGALSTLITTLLVGSREVYAVSKHNFFKNFFAKLNKWQVPSRTVWFVGAIALVLILTDSVEFVAYLANSVYLISLLLVITALFKMRAKRPFLERPFKIPLFPWLLIGVGGLSLLVLLFVEVKALIITFIWALIGFVLYLTAQIKKERARLMMIGMLVLLNLVLFSFLLSCYLTL